MVGGVGVAVLVVAVSVMGAAGEVVVVVAVVPVMTEEGLVFVELVVVEVTVLWEVAVAAEEVVEVAEVMAVILVFILAVFVAAVVVACGWEHSERWAAFLRKHLTPYLQGGFSGSPASGDRGAGGVDAAAGSDGTVAAGSADTRAGTGGTAAPIPVLGLKNEVIIEGWESVLDLERKGADLISVGSKRQSVSRAGQSKGKQTRASQGRVGNDEE
jgi:hypothetical protein